MVSKQDSGIFHSDMKIFTELLFADQLRGGDGTGIVYNNGKRLNILKAPIGSSDFVISPQYDRATSAIIKGSNFVIGHNRAATKGKIDQDSTHPFKHKHITLVHNGTLTYHKDLADVEVDSHAITISIAEIGLKETLKKISGAYALIWTDSNKKTLNIIRNSQRPLYVVETDFLFLFVSESKLAEWILDRNRHKITSIKEVPIHTLFQFEFDHWNKYETQKIDVYSGPLFLQQNKSTSITPYNEAPKTPTETSPKIGDKIVFSPSTVDTDGGIKLLGKLEDKKTKEVIDVRFWTNDINRANELVKETMLEGVISHIAYNPSKHSKYYILGKCNKLSNEANVVGKSSNGIYILESDMKKLITTCNCCRQKLDKTYIKDHISECDFDIKDSIVEYSCPDCTDWMHNRPYFKGY